MADAQNNARALMEAGVLDAFVTTFAYSGTGWIGAGLKLLPPSTAERISRELGRRSIDQVATSFVHTYPMWEFARSAATKLARGPVAADLMWDQVSHSFDRLVARRYVPRTQAIQAYEYTALSSFQRAEKEGVARILCLPSLDSLHFEEMQRREKSEWPELAGRHDAYFDAKFERRYARRRNEIALADVIVVNSSLTARSHILAGADPNKVLSVPLASPRPLDSVQLHCDQTIHSLKIMWAGTFSLRKGAHYFIQALNLLNAKASVQVEVYGQVMVPDKVSAMAGDEVTFCGSVERARLFKAYQSADVLVFPTLSDGFGMVVAEAMAHGLPVITTDQAGASDLVTPENGIVIPAANPRALADALQWCLDNRHELAAMRHSALDTARRRQWSDYRRELIVKLESGLRRAGYSPSFRNGA